MGLLKKIQFRLFLVFALLLSALFGMAQERTVTGIVSDADDGTALPGATILEKGTSNGTITDVDGRYQLAVSSDDVILTFSFVGFETIEVPVGSKSVVNASLGLSLSELNEVVVIGYGVQQKKVATGSISKVDAKNLEGYKVPNVTSALDGQVSGVVVSNSSGQPGSAQNIYIRGIGTNGSNDPLYIVDGLAVTNIGNINPSDVESVNVLKDAASAAIYGTRAANGVIIITTKRGSKGKGTISYEGFTGFSNPWKLPEMLDSDEYIELTREKFANAGQTASLDNLGFPQIGDEVNNTRWMDQIFNQSTQMSHVVSASLDNSYLSLEYWDQNGVIGGEKSNYRRYSARFNSTKDINEFVSIGQNAYLSRRQNQNLGVNNAFGTVIADAFAYDPLTEVYADNGPLGYGFAQSQWVQKEYINPLSRLFLANNNGHEDEVQGNVFLKMKPLEGLTLQTDFGGTASWWQYRSFTPDYDFHGAAFNVDNQVSQGGGTNQTFQWENFLAYEKDLGNHSFNLTLGTSFYRYDARIEYGGSTRNIPDAEKFNPNFQLINAGQDTSDLAYGYFVEPHRILSYFGRIIYDYNDKYLFTATIRQDGSTQFGSNKRWGYFPSMSLGWVVSDESFFPTSPISFMKLRTSWGVNGNDRIRNLAYESTVVSDVRYPLGTDPSLNLGTAPKFAPNPNIKWEESVQFDVGLELSLFDGRLSTEFDYYVKTTKDLLGGNRIPAYIGFPGDPTYNLGEVENKGFEASISFRQSIGDLNLRSTLNYTTFKNTVVAVPSSTGTIDGWNWPVRNAVITRMSEGLPIGYFRGYKTAGIFRNQDDLYAHLNSNGDFLQPNAELGDLIFEDVNGDGVINSDDVTAIGSPWPDHIFGFSLSADFKGFDLSVLFSSQIGHDIYRTYERSDITFSNYQKFWLDRYTESNPEGEYPRLVANDPNGNQRPSDFYVEDGSFLRLRNLQLGYSLPQALLEKINLSGLRIYLSANNLLTVTKYSGFDPEIGTDNYWILNTGIDKGYYPSNKTIGAGIKISM